MNANSVTAFAPSGLMEEFLDTLADEDIPAELRAKVLHRMEHGTAAECQAIADAFAESEDGSDLVARWTALFA